MSYEFDLIDIFLASLQSAPIDSQDECTDCTIKYSDSQDKHITTDCGHTYHTACLRPWLEENVTALATYTMCRAKLFERPDFKRDVYGDYYSDDDDDDDCPQDPCGWEGLWVAYREVNDMHRTISEHIQHFWSIVDHHDGVDTCESTTWEPFITAVLDVCAISRGGTYMPCSATEFVLVKGIIDLLAGLAEAKEKDTKELRRMLRIL